jgi:hypothetical protein
MEEEERGTNRFFLAGRKDEGVNAAAMVRNVSTYAISDNEEYVRRAAGVGKTRRAVHGRDALEAKFGESSLRIRRELSNLVLALDDDGSEGGAGREDEVVLRRQCRRLKRRCFGVEKAGRGGERVVRCVLFVFVTLDGLLLVVVVILRLAVETRTKETTLRVFPLFPPPRIDDLEGRVLLLTLAEGEGFEGRVEGTAVVAVVDDGTGVRVGEGVVTHRR